MRSPDAGRGGCISAEVWVKVAAAGDLPPTLVSPADPGELTFLLLSTGIPAPRRPGAPGQAAGTVAEFTGPDDGQTAHYLLRCLSPDVHRDGEAGPWSETRSATIGA